jgi:hypothetical protein
MTRVKPVYNAKTGKVTSLKTILRCSFSALNSLDDLGSFFYSYIGSKIFEISYFHGCSLARVVKQVCRMTNRHKYSEEKIIHHEKYLEKKLYDHD